MYKEMEKKGNDSHSPAKNSNGNGWNGIAMLRLVMEEI